MKLIFYKPVLLATMLATAFSASAYDFEHEGIFYDVTSTADLTCEVVNKKTDDGKIDVNSYAGDIEIPPYVEFRNKKLKVTAIGDEAFRGCTQLKSIKYPETVESIGDYAFAECTQFESISLPHTIKHLGYGVFRGWTQLVSVELPNSLTYIYGGTFSGCSNLEKIKLPDGIDGIPEYMFAGCRSLKELILPSAVSYIGRHAFSGCTSLKSINLENINTIEEYAFSNCNLSNIKFSDNLKYIGECAFWHSSLEEISLPKSLNKLSAEVFSYCGELKKVVLEESSKPLIFDLGSLYLNPRPFSPFRECPKLTSLEVYRNIEAHYETSDGDDRIESDPWRSIFVVDSITSLFISNNVDVWQLFGEYAKNYKSLTHLGLGSYVNRLNGAYWPEKIRLYNCTNLQTITALTETPPECPNCSKEQYMNLKVRVPKGCLEMYQNAKGWKNFWDIEEVELSGVEDILDDSNGISVRNENGSLFILNKKADSVVRVFSIQGTLLKETREPEIHDLPNGMYIVNVEGQSFKILLR